VKDDRGLGSRTSGTISRVRIFISYRRDDSEDATGRLYDMLAARFGADQVFMDIDAIPLGLDFARVIRDAVAGCDVFVAVIGKQWLTVTDSNGVRRIDNPDDFVRLEVKEALERDLRLIPVLVQGAEVPAAESLPPDVAALSRRNGIALRGATWRAGAERLIAAIEEEELRRAAPEGSESVAAANVVPEREVRDTADPGAPRAVAGRRAFWQPWLSRRWAVLGGVVALGLVAAGIVIATDRRGSRHADGGSPGATGAKLTFLGSTADPTVVVSGGGFGAHPPIAYPANNTQCGYYANNGNWFGANGLWFRDSTHSWLAGQGNSTGGSCIGLVVVSWSPTQVTFRFGNAYNTFDHWSADTGDAVTVVVNGDTLSGTIRF
jgi:TIR domain